MWAEHPPGRERKIIQLLVSGLGVIGLADDGTVWCFQEGSKNWKIFAQNIPPKPERKPWKPPQQTVAASALKETGE